MLPYLAPFWNDGYERYVEPFMGSASLFFAVAPRKALLGDMNNGLVETFITVRDHPEALHEALIQIPLGKESYYKLRGMAIEGMSQFERAARFIFLNRFCFNGLYRTNKRGEFNVPFSPSRTGHLPTKADLLVVSQALGCADIRCADFEEVLDDVGEGEFVYLDPPYAVSNRRIFHEYGPRCFGTSDLKRLSSALDRLDKRGATFVVSYAFCEEARDAFKKWNMQKVFINRNIAGFAKNRRRAAEVVVSNRQNANSGQSKGRRS